MVVSSRQGQSVYPLADLIVTEYKDQTSNSEFLIMFHTPLTLARGNIVIITLNPSPIDSVSPGPGNPTLNTPIKNNKGPIANGWRTFAEGVISP